MNQSELAKKAGIARSIMSELETGKRMYSIKTMFKVMLALDVCPSVILGDVVKDEQRAQERKKIKRRIHAPIRPQSNE